MSRETVRTIIRPKDRIMINHHLDGKIALSIRKMTLDFTEITNRPSKPQPILLRTDIAPQKPGLNSQRWVS